MKTLFAIVLLSLSVGGFAQRVETTINGVRYSCHPANDQSDDHGPYDPIACSETAYRGPFSREESLRLCAGARTVAPAECAIKAYAGPFSKEESINLCIRAISTAPVDCFNKAYSGPFSKEKSLELCKGAHSVGPGECAVKAYAGPFSLDEAVRLCSSPRANVATADCAIRAYSGPYSREESISMCMRSSFKSNIALSKESFEALMIKANEKAVLEGTYKK